VTVAGNELLSRGNELITNLRDGDWKEQTKYLPPSSLPPSSLPPSYHPFSKIYYCLSPQSPWSPFDINETQEVQIDAEGTPGYLPPEILVSGVSPGWPVDYWSLGCVVYFCLFGRPRYYGSNFEQVNPPLLALPS
jgi:serine/threonine protein kinase